jgi:hypothetical protein
VQVKQPEKQEKHAVAGDVLIKPAVLQLPHVIALLTGVVQVAQATLQG